MILIIDHYDSFVYNLARYFEELGHATQVVRQEAIGVAEVKRLAPSHIVLSPGPCGPEEMPISCEIVRHYWGQLPFLGVCLGHQIIAHVGGARIVRAKQPLHGQASWIHHLQTGLFAGIETPCQVGRYHSLIVEAQSLPKTLPVTARSDAGEIMAFESRSLRIAGVQFHPESVLTACGYQLLTNFLEG